jgi:cell wall-associated NlpC family hydrolase
VRIGAWSAALVLSVAGCATRPTASDTAVSHPVPAVGGPTAGTATPLPSGGDRLAQNALAMLGQPYRWGGASPGGFDCSGLVAYVAQRAGVAVPRTAAEQQRAGIAVSREELQPGDLVFLHFAAKELHVGIALDGTRFIHAPSSGGRVRIDSLSAHPYARAFLNARRLIFPPSEPAR